MIPDVSEEFINHTENDLALENKYMYKDQAKPKIYESVDNLNLDFEYSHRNQNKSFLERSKTIRKIKNIYRKRKFDKYY